MILLFLTHCCYYSNRKGKLFFFYEFVIKIKWSGHTFSDPDDKCTGTIEVVNLSDENDIDNIDVSYLPSLGQCSYFKLRLSWRQRKQLSRHTH